MTQVLKDGRAQYNAHCMEVWQKSRDNNWEERKRIWFEKAEELVRESLRERIENREKGSENRNLSKKKT